MIGRVATFSFQNSLLSSSMRIQSSWSQTQSQLASGLKAENYTGLGNETDKALSLEKVLAESTARSTTLDTISGRVNEMYSSLSGMTDLLTSLRSGLTAATTGTTNQETLIDSAPGWLEDMADLMNLQFEGRYLFGGSVTDQAPVDLDSQTAQTVPSSADTSYYQGNSDIATATLSLDQEITYGVTANSSGFEKALRALKLATTSPYDETTANEAYTLATEALDELTAAQSKLSVVASRVESAQEREATRQDSVTDALSTLTGADTAAVTVEASTYEAQLQASYSALAKINGLSLLDYL